MSSTHATPTQAQYLGDIVTEYADGRKVTIGPSKADMEFIFNTKYNGVRRKLVAGRLSIIDGNNFFLDVFDLVINKNELTEPETKFKVAEESLESCVPHLILASAKAQIKKLGKTLKDLSKVVVETKLIYDDKIIPWKVEELIARSSTFHDDSVELIAFLAKSVKDNIYLLSTTTGLSIVEE